MTFSQRERLILLIASTAVAILLLDYYVVTPLMESRNHLDDEISTRSGEWDSAMAMLDLKPRMLRKWKAMAAANLKTEASAAESQVIHAVRDWAQDAGLTLAALNRDRTEQDGQFQRISFRATVTGTMAATSRFLWRVESASIPARIIDLQVSSRKDGVDDLSVQIGISTLCLAEDAAKPGNPPPTSGPKEELR